MLPAVPPSNDTHGPNSTDCCNSGVPAHAGAFHLVVFLRIPKISKTWVLHLLALPQKSESGNYFSVGLSGLYWQPSDPNSTQVRGLSQRENAKAYQLSRVQSFLLAKSCRTLVQNRAIHGPKPGHLWDPTVLYAHQKENTSSTLNSTGRNPRTHAQASEKTSTELTEEWYIFIIN